MCGMVQESFSKLMARPLPGKSWKPMVLFWRDVWKKHLGQLRIPQPYLILPEHNINFLLNRDERRHLWTAEKLESLKTLEPCCALPVLKKLVALLSQFCGSRHDLYLRQATYLENKTYLIFARLKAPVFDANISIWVHIVYVFDKHACSISFIPRLRCEMWLSRSKTGTSDDLIAPIIFKWKVRCPGLNCFQSQASLGIP